MNRPTNNGENEYWQCKNCGRWLSSDHLYDLQIPKQFPSILKSRLKKFQSRCLHLGHGFPEEHATLADYKWAIKEGKALLRAIDKQLGIESTQGDWE